MFYRSGISDDGMPRAPSIDTSADGLLIPGVIGDKTDAEDVFSLSSTACGYDLELELDVLDSIYCLVE